MQLLLGVNREREIKSENHSNRVASLLIFIYNQDSKIFVRPQGSDNTETALPYHPQKQKASE